MNNPEQDVTGWHLREDAHYNGGNVFFAYLMRCVEQPRLQRYDRYERKSRTVVSIWRVDGIDQSNFDAAMVSLRSAPSFTPDELEELSKVSDEYVDIRKIMDFGLNHALVNKGAVEWKEGKCRRRKADGSVSVEGG